MARQGFYTRDKTATATGGMHENAKLAKTRKSRKDHDHRVSLGKLPMDYGESHGTQKMISNHKGGDRSTMQGMKAAKRQVGRHKISLRSC